MGKAIRCWCSGESNFWFCSITTKSPASDLEIWIFYLRNPHCSFNFITRELKFCISVVKAYISSFKIVWAILRCRMEAEFFTMSIAWGVRLHDQKNSIFVCFCWGVWTDGQESHDNWLEVKKLGCFNLGCVKSRGQSLKTHFLAFYKNIFTTAVILLESKWWLHVCWIKSICFC